MKINDKLKLIAYYLPQFHETVENSQWWGEGYTEWTAVRKAEKLFENHYQPRKPLNNNYYDITKKETMMWQVELAKKYGIHGFCFFHYFFKDGRMVLNKPIRNLLEWTDVHMNFCFSWPTVSWTRTWSKLSGGCMASKFEKFDGNEEGVLLEQNFGDKDLWLRHFNYLLPFFKDQRYIKIDNKPVFIFHDPELVDCLNEMVQFWRILAKENGFEDIYFIGTIIDSAKEYSCLNAVYAHEPRISMKCKDYKPKDNSNLSCVDYETLSNVSINRVYFQKQKLFYGVFPSFDTSPRHDKRGFIVDKSTPELFRRYLYLICQKSAKVSNEFVFINAWNEWGEGNYLEPDSVFNYQYLESVRNVLNSEFDSNYDNSSLTSIEGVLRKKNETIEKEKMNARIYALWIDKILEGKSIEAYFNRNKIKSFSLYGYGDIGKKILKSLDKKVKVDYIIDRSKKINGYIYDFYSPFDDFPPSDLLIISIPFEIDAIKNDLKESLFKFTKVITITELLNEL